VPQTQIADVCVPVDPEELLGAEIKFPDVDIALALSRCGKL